jgi:uncharacterized membrane protein YvbJ
MYCEGCGTQIQSGLNYCSRCGRRVADDAKEAAMNAPTIAASAAGVGFVSYIFVILVLSKAGVLPDIILKISFVYFGALFGICFLILKQGFGEKKTAAKNFQPLEKTEPAYLRPATTSQLPDAHTDPASVTEHTTRELDAVLSERK